MSNFVLPSKVEARDRFWELQGQIDALRANSDPLRARRDDLVNKARAEEEALNAEIREIEGPIYDLKMELSMMAALAGGYVGAKP